MMEQSLIHGANRLRLGLAKLSQHAASRCQQRAIPAFVIDALQDHGESAMVGEGCQSFYFTRRSWNCFMAYMGPAARSMDKFRNAYIIIAASGMVVTAAWRH